MTRAKTFASLALALALAAAPAIAADAPQQHDQHHPAAAAPAPNTPAAPASGAGMGMMGGGMMGGNMPMMGMMEGGGMGMAMMGGGMGRMGGMGMMSSRAGHVEGRIAFLKAELKITDAQALLWNAVADAMRANAKTMVDMRVGMMGKTDTMSLPERLAAREKAFTARLDGLKKLKSAIDPLYTALSDEQKKTADQIVTGMGTGCGGGAGMGCGGMGLERMMTR